MKTSEPSPNVRAAHERDVREAWSERYGKAKRAGFSDADARLHANQAADLVRRTQS